MSACVSARVCWRGWVYGSVRMGACVSTGACVLVCVGCVCICVCARAFDRESELER